MGGIAGFGMGMGVVLLVGLMDRRVRHASDAKVGQAQVRMLGVLPTLPDDMSDPHQAEQASHSVHHIRTLLQIGRGAQRVFAITSPTPGSGKSSLTAALGLSFAASDNKVLLIDCDLVGGGLTRRIGSVVHEPLERMLLESGLLDEQQLTLASTESARRRMPLEQVLLEEGYVEPDQLERLARRQRDTTLGILDACEGKPLRACVADTGIRNVKILPVGSARPQDAGTLSPAALRRLIADAREAYDVVLLDTGPVLGSLEAAMAAAEADASVLIVSRGDQKSLVMRAMEHLRSVGATMAGVVFNHALDADINSTDYASVVSVDRRVDATRSTPVADPGAAARFGPLGSAVASYGSSRDLELRSSSPVAVTNGTSSNGNGHHG
jgi:Mrp family chromosome partitioning ATPase